MFHVFWSQGFKTLFMKEDVRTLFEKMLQKTQTLERAHQEGVFCLKILKISNLSQNLISKLFSVGSFRLI